MTIDIEQLRADALPDRVMVRPMMGAAPQGATHQSGPWALDNPYGNAVPYVREQAYLDLHGQNRKLREVLRLWVAYHTTSAKGLESLASYDAAVTATYAALAEGGE